MEAVAAQAFGDLLDGADEPRGRGARPAPFLRQIEAHDSQRRQPRQMGADEGLALVEFRRARREVARGEAPDGVLDGKIFGGGGGDHRRRS